MQVSLFNAPHFLSVSEKTRFSSAIVPAFVCPPLNFSCFHSFMPSLRTIVGYVVIWNGFVMSPCASNSNKEAFFHLKLSAGTCPVKDSKVCRILQQNSVKVVLNDAVIIDTSAADVFQESITVSGLLWPGALNSIEIWWRHQRLPTFDDIQFQVTTSCSSKTVLPSSLWFYSKSDDVLVGAWPSRILFQGCFFVQFDFLNSALLTNRSHLKVFQKCICKRFFILGHCGSDCFIHSYSSRQFWSWTFL